MIKLQVASFGNMGSRISHQPQHSSVLTVCLLHWDRRNICLCFRAEWCKMYSRTSTKVEITAYEQWGTIGWDHPKNGHRIENHPHFGYPEICDHSARKEVKSTQQRSLTPTMNTGRRTVDFAPVKPFTVRSHCRYILHGVLQKSNKLRGLCANSLTTNSTWDHDGADINHCNVQFVLRAGVERNLIKGALVQHLIFPHTK